MCGDGGDDLGNQVRTHVIMEETIHFLKGIFTLPETHMASPNAWLEGKLPFGKVFFHGLRYFQAGYDNGNVIFVSCDQDYDINNQYFNNRDRKQNVHNRESNNCINCSLRPQRKCDPLLLVEE